MINREKRIDDQIDRILEQEEQDTEKHKSEVIVVDLNEEAFQSKYRLMGLYRNVAKKQGVRKAMINKNIERMVQMGRRDMISELKNLLDGWVKFTYGDGDVDNTEGEKKPITVKTEAKKNTKKTKKNKKSKKVTAGSTQLDFEENIDNA